MSNFDDVKKLHEKFDLPINNVPTQLGTQNLSERILFMFEELQEFATGAGFLLSMDDDSRLDLIQTGDERDMAEQADALIDLAYVAMGTGVMMGIPWQTLWDDVQRANMGKVRGMTHRGNKVDLTKPPHWVKPQTSEILKAAHPKGIIVLDGPDGCGKTTLAMKLCEMYDGYYMHHTWTPELELTMDLYLEGGLNEAIEVSKERLVVIDRLWLSEFCYSKAMRGGTRYPNLHKQLYDTINEVGALNIVCLPSHKSDAMKRFENLKEERAEHYDNIEKVYDLYMHLFFGFKNDLDIEPIGHSLFNDDNYIRYDMDYVPLVSLESYCRSVIKEHL